MVDQIHRNASLDRESKSPISAAALDLSPDKNSLRRSQIDEVIGSLANAYENKRARQVSEWERLWRQNLSDTSYRAVL